MQQRLLAASALTLLVATPLLAGCGRAEQASAPAQAPSALPQPELVSPVSADPLSGTDNYYPAPASLDAQPDTANLTPTFASRREEIQAHIDWVNGRATARALQYQSDNATAIARGDPPLPTETPPPWDPTSVPDYFKSMPGGGFLNPLSHTDLNSNIYITNSWIYDLPNNEQIKVLAGAIIREWGPEGRQHLPEPYQGILLLREYVVVPDDLGPLHAGESQVLLPVKDGAAQVLDTRVQGERLLLTISTTGGSVYVFDVRQKSFSAPQPPTLTVAAPETKPDGTVWLQASGEDQAGALLSYAWDLDGDGLFETEGNPVQLPAGAQVAGRVVTARVTARSGLEATAQVTLER